MLLRKWGFDQARDKGDNGACHVACCFGTQTVDFEFQLSQISQGRVFQFGLCHLCSLSVRLRVGIAVTVSYEIYLISHSRYAAYANQNLR